MRYWDSRYFRRVLNCVKLTAHSRSQAYTRVEFRYLRNDTYSLFINYDIDILYLRQKIPYSVLEHGPAPKRRRVGPDWSQPLKRIVINLDRVSRELRVYPAHPGHLPRRPTLWVKFKAFFPNLEELVVVLHPNLEKVNRIEELVLVTKGDMEETTEDDVQATRIEMMDKICSGLEDGPDRRRVGPLKLTFMRVPVERRRTLCERCCHVIHKPGTHRPGQVFDPVYESIDQFNVRFCDPWVQEIAIQYLKLKENFLKGPQNSGW